MSSIVIVRTYNTFWERTQYELWEGLLPVIFANNYLHSHLVLSDNTLAYKAYSLAHFFRFLKRNKLTFFDLISRSIDPYILKFKNELLLRARTRQFAGDDLSKNVVKPICFSHAKSILAEAGWLCVWWGLVEVRRYRPVQGRGRSRNNGRSLPDIFQISIPRASRPVGENHALEPSEVEAIWNYLTREARPVKPPTLIQYPSKPVRGWSSLKVSAWNKAYRHYRVQIAWFHRQQMLWALMIGSAMRRSEVPLLMLVDLLFFGDDLWVALRLRRSTACLGRAKTGRRTIFIGWDKRVRTAWENWTRSRQVLIDLWMARTGRPDHDMFLTNRDGGPLTVGGMDSLFKILNTHFRIFGGAFPEDQFEIHSHAIRHTVESLFKQWEVPLDVRQRHLGHKNPETTNLYGRIYRNTYTTALTKLNSNNSQTVGGGVAE